MEKKYYVHASSSGEMLSLFRMDFGDETLDELKWDGSQWVGTNDLTDALFDGDPDTFEVTESVARKSAPEAFKSGLGGDDNATLVSKAENERRFTLGPMYIPNRKDAHTEWTDPEELQKAVWEYVKKGDRRIRLQHDKKVVAGEWLEIMAWPYEVEAPMIMKDGSEKPMKFPANTVFLGVKWEPWAWKMVKDGDLRGYSIGGKAERLLVDLPKESVGKAQAPFGDAIRIESDSVPDSMSVGLEERIAAVVAEAVKSINPVVNVVMPDDKPKVRRVERDENGAILRIIEE